MDDFSALAQRISLSVREVRGCLILSRDGLVLGAYPDEAEALAKPAWLKFVTLGEPEKSFVEFGDQVWAYVRRGTYGAFAIAEAGCRPGILVDQLDQILLSAEEARTRRDTLRVPDAGAAPSGKPRTSLHPSASGKAQAEDLAEIATPSEVAGSAKADGKDKGSHWRRDPPLTPSDVKAVGGDPAREAIAPSVSSEVADAKADPSRNGDAPDADTAGVEHAGSTLSREPKRLVSSQDGKKEDETEVDRVLLAQEFSGLLQVDTGDDEASS